MVPVGGMASKGAGSMVENMVKGYLKIQRLVIPILGNGKMIHQYLLLKLLLLLIVSWMSTNKPVIEQWKEKLGKKLWK